MADAREDHPAEDYLVSFGVLNDLRAPAAQAVLLLGELRGLTEWDDDTLCAQLYCDVDKWTQAGGAKVGGTNVSHEDALKHSLLFLRLVRDATRRLDRTNDCREVVNAAAELCHEAGGEVVERAPRMRAALEHTPAGDLSPFDLLDLGEIGRAWRSAALNMESGPAYDRAVAAARLAGGVAAHTVHLSAERLELLAESNAEDLLGTNVSKRMRKHLLNCTKCQKLAESLGLDDLLRPSKLLRPVAA